MSASAVLPEVSAGCSDGSDYGSHCNELPQQVGALATICGSLWKLDSGLDWTGLKPAVYRWQTSLKLRWPVSVSAQSSSLAYWGLRCLSLISERSHCIQNLDKGDYCWILLVAETGFEHPSHRNHAHLCIAHSKLSIHYIHASVKIGVFKYFNRNQTPTFIETYIAQSISHLWLGAHWICA